jgi:3-oxoadipate CoA-transferase, alpha subunit
MPMNKTLANLADAVSGIRDGQTVMIGGFGGSGAPVELIHALIDRYRVTGSPNNLTVINNNAGNGHVGLAALIEHGMVRKLICSFPRSADPVVFTELYQAGKIELELVPQGTFEGRSYVRENWLRADHALIKAHVADTLGNLTYRMAARNFNPLMAMAAAHTVVQVQEIVQPGGIDPEAVITPGIFVQGVVLVRDPQQEEDLNRANARYPETMQGAA